MNGREQQAIKETILNYENIYNTCKDMTAQELEQYFIEIAKNSAVEIQNLLLLVFDCINWEQLREDIKE